MNRCSTPFALAIALELELPLVCERLVVSGVATVNARVNRRVNEMNPGITVRACVNGVIPL